MELARIRPDLRSVMRWAPKLPFHQLWRLPANRLLLRLACRHRLPGDVQVSERCAGDVRVRVYTPRERRTDGALLWLHGGGFIMGTPRMEDRYCAAVASVVGATVLCPAYRLAPEHPFPAALDDALHVWRWLQRTGGELGLDPRRVAVGGVSAGGGLAAGLTQRLRDEGDPAPAAQLLLHPMLDDRTAARPELDDRGYLVWDNRDNRAAWRAYLGREPGGPQAPRYAAPARERISGDLPPAWLGVAELDLFHDENMAYAEALRAAGVTVETEVATGAFHGFVEAAPDAALSLDFSRKQHDFLRAHLCDG